MAYKKLILPSALMEFETFCRVQGRRVRKAARAWTDDLARVASHIDACLTVVRLEHVLGRIQSGLPKGVGRWHYAYLRFKRATVRKKLRALVALVQKRKPPWEPFVAERRFQRSDEGCSVLRVFFEINHATEQIVFAMFASDEESGP